MCSFIEIKFYIFGSGVDMVPPFYTKNHLLQEDAYEVLRLA